VKRFLALALAVVFVLGFAATAMAAHLEVTGNGSGLKFNGEYKFRGTSTNNTNDGANGFDDNNNDRRTAMGQRLRFIISAVVGEDVSVITRFTVSNGDFDGTAQTGGNQTTTDWAYLQAKKFGGTWFIGRQPASWGHGFVAKGVLKDRIKYVTKLSDMLTLGGVIQKNDETYNVTGGGDSDTYYVLGVATFGDHKVGLIYADTNNNVTAADDDATWMDVYYAGKAGPVSIAAEYSVSDNDSWVEPAAQVDPMVGMFVSANMDVSDMINVGLAFATAQNGFTADNDFGASMLVGTEVNATAIGEFGDLQTAGLTGKNDDTATSIVVSGAFKLSDDLTLGANVAQHQLSDNAELDALEMGVKADYKIATNTTLTAGYVMASPSISAAAKAAGGKEDDITSAALQIKTVW